MEESFDLEQDYASLLASGVWPMVAEPSRETRFSGPLAQQETVLTDEARHKDEQDLIVLKDNTTDVENQYAFLSEQDAEGDTPLHSAIIVGATELALQMIDLMCPIQLNITNQLQQSPIHLAGHVGDTHVLKSLVEHGADLTARDKNGRTVFHIISANNKPETLQVFSSYLEQKISQTGPNCSLYQKLRETLNLKDNDGQTCLHVTCRDTIQPRKVEMVKTLIQLGADINSAESKCGKTVIHIASETGRSDVVKFLTSECREVDLEQTTYDGQTALVGAYHRRHSNVVGILRNAGAKFSKKEIQKFGPFRE